MLSFIPAGAPRSIVEYLLAVIPGAVLLFAFFVAAAALVYFMTGNQLVTFSYLPVVCIMPILAGLVSTLVLEKLRRKPLTGRSQVLLNRVTNLFVSLFVLFWGVWYTLPGPIYFYLNITATIFLGGAFSAVIAALYWKRANTFGGYCAMIAGAVGSVGFFFFKTPASWAGLGSFALAGAGMIVGSYVGSMRRKHAEVGK